MCRLFRIAGRTLTLLPLICAMPFSYGAEQEEWHFEIQYQIASIPHFRETYQRDQCLTEQIQFPDIFRPGIQCTTKIHSRFEKTLTWLIDCSNGWEIVQGMGRATFDGGIAKGEVHIQILAPRYDAEFMAFQIEGRPLGKCPG